MFKRLILHTVSKNVIRYQKEGVVNILTKGFYPMAVKASWARSRGRRLDRLLSGSDTMNHQKKRATHVAPEAKARF